MSISFQFTLSILLGVSLLFSLIHLFAMKEKNSRLMSLVKTLRAIDSDRGESLAAMSNPENMVTFKALDFGGWFNVVAEVNLYRFGCHCQKGRVFIKRFRSDDKDYNRILAEELVEKLNEQYA